MVKKVVKKPVKKAPPKREFAPVSKKVPLRRSQIKSTSGKTTADFRPGREFSGRGSAFSLQKIFGFKISKDASGGTPAGGASNFKPKNIIK